MQRKYKHSFTDSKMNKDLDARLLSPREYRDAVNVSVSRSEGGDVGALENILGNELLTTLTYTGATPAEVIGWHINETTDSIFIFLTNYTDNSTDKISNFAPYNSVHKIVYVNTITNNATVIVQGSFLNFSVNTPIYHADMIEDLLFWTDNRNQPRQINTQQAISDPAYYYNEDHISVAKYYPSKTIQLQRETTIADCVFLDKQIEGRTPPVTVPPTPWFGYDGVYDYFFINSASVPQNIINDLENNLGVKAYITDDDGERWEFKICWFQYDGQTVDVNGVVTNHDNVLPAPYNDPNDRKYLIFIDRDLSSANLTKYDNVTGIPVTPDSYTINYFSESSKNISDPWLDSDVKLKLEGAPKVQVGSTMLTGDLPYTLFKFGSRSIPKTTPGGGARVYSAWQYTPEDTTGGGGLCPAKSVANRFPTNTGAGQQLWPRVAAPKTDPSRYYVITNIILNNPLNFNGPLTLTFREYLGLRNSTLTPPLTGSDLPWDENDTIDVSVINKYFQQDFPGDPAFLEDKFVRFSYRYKYDDGEYSLIAPFTQAVFIPKQNGVFQKKVAQVKYSDNPTYLQDDLERAGETTVVDFFTNNVTAADLIIPLEYQANELQNKLKVKEIDILYKESNSLALKVVETLNIDDYNTVTDKKITYQYQSRKPIKVLPNSEITRVYDNVPVRAATQSSSGNRVIYGNFYDRHTSPLTLDYLVGISRKLSPAFEETTYSTVSYPNHTLKQNRSYQVGIVLSDRYGRQSDVILSSVRDLNYEYNIGLYANQPIVFGGSTIYSEYLPKISEQETTAQGSILTTQNPVANVIDWPGNSLKILWASTIPNTITTNAGYPGLRENIVTVVTIIASTVIGGETRFTLGPAIGNPLDVKPGMTLSWIESGVTSTNVVKSVDFTGATRYVFMEDATAPSSFPTDGVEVIQKNVLGWESYKVVVKQTEQDYYNVYLPALLKGNPVVKPFKLEFDITTDGIGTVRNGPTIPAAEPRTFLLLEGMTFIEAGVEYVITNILNNENFTVSPAPALAITNGIADFTTKVQNSLNVTTLLTDNANKVPPSINETTPVQQQYSTSDTRLIPRIAYSTRYVAPTTSDFYTVTYKGITQQFPERSSETVRAIGNFFNIFTDAATAGLYQADTDSPTGVIENSLLIGTPSETVEPDSVEKLLQAVYETNPVKSEIEIFWETSTSGSIKELNNAILSDPALPSFLNLPTGGYGINEAVDTTLPYTVGTFDIRNQYNQQIAYADLDSVDLGSVINSNGSQDKTTDFTITAVGGATNQYQLNYVNAAPTLFHSNNEFNNNWTVTVKVTAGIIPETYSYTIPLVIDNTAPVRQFGGTPAATNIELTNGSGDAETTPGTSPAAGTWNEVWATWMYPTNGAWNKNLNAYQEITYSLQASLDGIEYADIGNIFDDPTAFELQDFAYNPPGSIPLVTGKFVFVNNVTIDGEVPAERFSLRVTAFDKSGNGLSTIILQINDILII